VSGVMILELSVAASTVAVGWSGYAVSILKSAGIDVPVEFAAGPLNGGILNLPAMFNSCFCGISIISRNTR
jgi:APA family basic amino acid/polyamine antiporter